ncbi:MAG: glutaredoxin domain-containing protein [Woeseiaceae bacterium]|nr:glutaredoxin domain-containing protein [Woeseiaceae bacterium]
MKKFLAIAVALAVFQYWNSNGGSFFGSSAKELARGGVVLYATEWCGYCQETRKLFKKNRIPYVEYDIEKSKQAYREYKQLGGRGVPVVNAYGTVIHGYSPQRILVASRPRRR